MSLARNKKALMKYEVLERFEAGIELLGFEVKAVRAGRAALDGSHVSIRGGEAYLLGATIAPYQMNNTPGGYDPSRARRLLLSKKELLRLMGEESAGKLTIVPISMYTKGQRIKLELALVLSKKKHDKRAALKKREGDREIRRSLKI